MLYQTNEMIAISAAKEAGQRAVLLARAVIVVDENQNIIFSDLVEEITNEPDYEGAISVLKK